MITQEEAQSISLNRVDFKVKLTLYNGNVINCIPINYNSQDDSIHVAVLPSKEEINIRRDIIYKYDELNNRIINQPLFRTPLSFSNEYAKKLIIIGAGASHGYSYNLEGDKKIFVPPLANDIFSKEFNYLLDDFQGAKNLASSSVYIKDIELYFQQKWDKLLRYDVYDNSTISSLINTQYYLSALFFEISKIQKGNRNNYYQNLIQFINDYLSDKKFNEKVIVVSFNYDLLLEEVLSSYMQYKYSSTDDYVDFKNRNILLFKPHGSCNWFRSCKVEGKPSGAFVRLSDAVKKNANFVFSSKFHFGNIYESISDNIDILDDSSFGAGIGLPSVIIPQLLIPYKSKDDFAMPNQHLRILEHLLDKVEDVLIIGWKGTEQKFQNLLKTKFGNKEINITYANHNDDSILAEYRKLLPKAKIKNFNHYIMHASTNFRNRDVPDFGNLVRYLNIQDNFFFN